MGYLDEMIKAYKEELATWRVERVDDVIEVWRGRCLIEKGVGFEAWEECEFKCKSERFAMEAAFQAAQEHFSKPLAPLMDRPSPKLRHLFDPLYELAKPQVDAGMKKFIEERMKKATALINIAQRLHEEDERPEFGIDWLALNRQASGR